MIHGYVSCMHIHTLEILKNIWKRNIILRNKWILGLKKFLFLDHRSLNLAKQRYLVSRKSNRDTRKIQILHYPISDAWVSKKRSKCVSWLILTCLRFSHQNRVQPSIEGAAPLTTCCKGGQKNFTQRTYLMLRWNRSQWVGACNSHTELMSQHFYTLIQC